MLNLYSSCPFSELNYMSIYILEKFGILKPTQQEIDITENYLKKILQVVNNEGGLPHKK